MTYSDNVTRVTWGLRAIVLVAAAILVASSSAAQQRNYRRVVFVALNGQGRVTSKPAGVACPAKCRVFFLKDQHLQLIAHPAPGWKLAHWRGSCTGVRTSCAFDVADSHDCANGMCPIGAFGERVTFVRVDASS